MRRCLASIQCPSFGYRDRCLWCGPSCTQCNLSVCRVLRVGCGKTCGCCERVGSSVCLRLFVELSLLFGRVRGLACARLQLLWEQVFAVACFLGVAFRHGCFLEAFYLCLLPRTSHGLLGLVLMLHHRLFLSRLNLQACQTSREHQKTLMHKRHPQASQSVFA